VEIPLLICQFYFFTQLVFSVFFLLWNGAVGAALICVARTHTIAIRRFIFQLEGDAYLRDTELRKTLYSQDSQESRDTLQMYSWDNSLPRSRRTSRMESMSIQETTADRNSADVNILDDDSVDNAVSFDQAVQLELNDETSPPDGVANLDSEKVVKQQKSSKSKRRLFSSFRQLSEEDEPDDPGDVVEDDDYVPKLLSDDELLHKYWRHVNATRLTSNAFQRWMCLVTMTVLFWSAIRIVYWLSHSPSLYGVLSLILPLSILPLLASAYAEVNYQGIQVFQSILPTQERTAWFRYLYGNPIQLTVYNYPVNYGTMGTVLAAILAAFASRIFLQEMNKIL